MRSNVSNKARRLRSVARLLSIGVLFVWVVPAHAVLITQSVGFNVLSETRGNQPTLDFQAALPLFDPTLGTLQQVDLRYNFDLSLGINISNRTLSPDTVELGPTTLTIAGPRFFDRFSFNNLVASTSIDQTIDVPAGTRRTIGSITLTLPGRASTNVDIDRVFSRTSRPLTIRDIVLRPQGDVSPFVGIGDMLLDFTAMTRDPLALPMSGNILSGIRSSTSYTLGGSVDVTYDYLAAVVEPVPVPEPETVFLLGLGLLGLFARRAIS